MFDYRQSDPIRLPTISHQYTLNFFDPKENKTYSCVLNDLDYKCALDSQIILYLWIFLDGRLATVF